MKKIIGITMVAIIALFMRANSSQAAEIKINSNNFPDSTFSEYLLEEVDKNHNKKLSDAERNAVKELDLSDGSLFVLELGYDAPYSMEGIEYFPNLEKLDVTGGTLSKLDISKNKKLTELRCNNTELTKLSLKNNKMLKKLYCSQCKLKKLDLKANSELKILNCEDNKLSSIDLSPCTKLQSLFISGSKLKKLDLSKNVNLNELSCTNTQIKNLDLKNNIHVETIYCPNNKLTKLNVSTNIYLESLNCSNNQLTSLNLKNNTKLKYLNCANNSILSGNAMTSCTQMESRYTWPQKRTIKVKKVGKKYLVPIKGLKGTNRLRKLSAGKVTSKGILLKKKKLPKKITYEYNMFTDGSVDTKVIIKLKTSKKASKKAKKKKKKK